MNRRANKSQPPGGFGLGGRFLYDSLIIATPVDEEFVRQTVVTRIEASKKSGYRIHVSRHGSRIEDLRSCVDCAASVVVVASDLYLQQNQKQQPSELSTVAEICCSDGSAKRPKPLMVIAMDSLAAKKVRQNFGSIKSSNILVWGSTDFWQKLVSKLPDADATEIGDADVENVDKAEDDIDNDMTLM